MIRVKEFGTINGKDVPLIVLSDGKMSLELIPYGAAIRALWVPDKDGNLVDVALGYDTLEEYLTKDAYLGCAVGRHANRICRGKFSIDGKEYQVSCNEGPNHLHGGISGYNAKLWDYVLGEDSVKFIYDDPDGAEGFPGNLHVEITYTLENGAVCQDYKATTDQDTVVNLANHNYYNLAGHDGGPVLDHVVTIWADHYTPVDVEYIPTGEVAPVDGTLLDLRDGVVLGDRMEDPSLYDTKGYDHNFVLSGKGPALQMYCPRTGIAMEIKGTLEALQLYTGGLLTYRTGKGGAEYDKWHGICMENQHYPDAINHPNFPSPILRAGETYHESVAYRFFVKE